MSQICHHIVRYIRGIVPQQQYAAKAISDFEIVAVVLVAVRTDLVTDVVASSHVLLQIEVI